MPRPAPPNDGTLGELEHLTALLGESYASSYKASSLKVRRRYRKLLVALEAACRHRTHTFGTARNVGEGAGARGPVQRR